MKVAIQLFGHLRTYDKCYQRLFMCLADNYDCDVFVHTWDTLDHNTQTWHNYRIDKKVSIENIKQIVEECYQPKLYKIDTQKYIEEGNIIANNKAISLFGMHMMLYSMAESNKLRQQYEKTSNIKYDYIVFIRPDVELWTPLNLESFIDSTKPNELNNSFYFGGFFKYKNILNDWRAIGGSDVLFFGTSDVINKMFEHVEDIFSSIKKQELSVYGPEYSFLYAIDKMGIKLQMINYLWGENYTIIRSGLLPEKNPPKIKKDQWYKKIIRFKISDKMLKLRFLTIIPYNICEFEINIYHKYLINICLGTPLCWRLKND